MSEIREYVMNAPLDPTATPQSYLYYQNAIATAPEEEPSTFAPKMNIDTQQTLTTSQRIEGGLTS